MSALLDFVTYQELSNWSVAHLLQNHFNYNQSFPLVKIGSFLKRNKTLIEIDNDTVYKRVTIRLYNNGVLVRDTEIGKNIGTKKQFIIKEGQFLLSKIDARNGAFGLATKEVDGAIITADFLAFDLDASKIDPHFLVLMTTTKKFMQFAQSASSGTTGRQRIDESKFLETKIPLPSLETQQRIIQNYQAKILQGDEQEQEAKELEGGIKTYLSNELKLETQQEELEDNQGILNFINFSALSRWGLSYLAKEQSILFSSRVYPMKSLHSVIKHFEGGKTPSKANPKYWEGSISWASPKDFSGFEINSTIDHIGELAVQETGIKVFPKETVLIVFRSGILQHSIPIAITNIETSINQDLKAMRFDNTKINTKYFVYFVRNFQKEILNIISKKGATVESLEVTSFMDLKIPLPPTDIQDQIVDRIEMTRSKINTLNQTAQLNRTNAIIEFEAEIFDEA